MLGREVEDMPNQTGICNKFIVKGLMPNEGLYLFKKCTVLCAYYSAVQYRAENFRIEIFLLILSLI